MLLVLLISANILWYDTVSLFGDLSFPSEYKIILIFRVYTVYSTDLHNNFVKKIFHFQKTTQVSLIGVIVSSPYSNTSFYDSFIIQINDTQ